ncbi:MAG: hypothetical protein LBC77_01665 [Spirochaetaceae bacterium]|nr:hypothetical protein [Spirochaetaceae bacterium]
MHSKEKEAADAIKTVIAQYGYTPEFSDVRKQVGAVIASLSPDDKLPSSNHISGQGDTPIIANPSRKVKRYFRTA